LSYLGLKTNQVDISNEDVTLYMGKEDYNIDLVLEFYKSVPDMSGMGVLTQSLNVNVFAQFELESLTKQTRPMNINRLAKIQEGSSYDVLINSKLMDAFRYIVPYSRLVFPRIESDVATINISDSLNNS
jgi:hypothetical protein